MIMCTGVDFVEARGRRPLGSDTEGAKYFWPPRFFGKYYPFGTQGKYVPSIESKPHNLDLIKLSYKIQV